MFHKTGEASEKERLPKVLSHVVRIARKYFSAERRLVQIG